MTKQTYAYKIYFLKSEWSVRLDDVCSVRQAAIIAADADDEIKKLKGLLEDARLFLADSGCKNFIEEIEKALYD